MITSPCRRCYQCMSLQEGNISEENRDGDENPVEVRNSNPLLESRVYTVDFNDVTLHKYMENMIDENMYTQVDDEVRDHLLMIKIIDY